jgi:hypothetical protein
MTDGHVFDCLGLDITKDRILEIACIITDGKLTKRIEVAIETKYFSWFGCYDYFSLFFFDFFALRDIILAVCTSWFLSFGGEHIRISVFKADWLKEHNL